jgi:hypothetical protein
VSDAETLLVAVAETEEDNDREPVDDALLETDDIFVELPVLEPVDSTVLVIELLAVDEAELERLYDNVDVALVVCVADTVVALVVCIVEDIVLVSVDDGDVTSHFRKLPCCLSSMIVLRWLLNDEQFRSPSALSLIRTLPKKHSASYSSPGNCEISSTA